MIVMAAAADPAETENRILSKQHGKTNTAKFKKNIGIFSTNTDNEVKAAKVRGDTKTVSSDKDYDEKELKEILTFITENEEETSYLKRI